MGPALAMPMMLGLGGATMMPNLLGMFGIGGNNNNNNNNSSSSTDLFSMLFSTTGLEFMMLGVGGLVIYKFTR
jgi:hypothetical protein